MKKVIICALALVVFCTSAFSQSSSGSSEKLFHFGLNVTPGVYWLKANSQTDASNGSSFGFGYGLNLEFYFTPNYGIATGLEVNQFSAKYTNTVNANKNPFQDSVTAHVTSLQYLEIPILLKMKTNAIGMIKYFGQIGLGTGILLKASDDYTVTGGETQLSSSGTYSENNVKVNSTTMPVRLALVVGLGLEYNIAGTTSIQGAVNFNNGFLNTNKDGNNAVLSKGITLTIGVLF